MSKSIGTVVVMSALFLGLFFGCGSYSEPLLTTDSFAQNTLTETPCLTGELAIDGVFTS